MKAKDEERMLAIWQSVEHWFENYEIAINPNGTPDDLQIGSKHCALCHYDSNLSNPTYPETAPPDKPRHVTCTYCPIYHYCGSVECINTPYSDVNRAIDNYYEYPDYPWNDDNRRFLAGLVENEYGFLVDVAFAEYEEIWA